MTQVVFLELFEQYENGKSYNLERTLANGLCKKNICVPFTVHQEMLRNAEQKKKEKVEAEEKAKAEADEKAEAEKKRIKKLVSAKNKPGRKRAVSVKAETSEKAINT